MSLLCHKSFAVAPQGQSSLYPQGSSRKEHGQVLDDLLMEGSQTSLLIDNVRMCELELRSDQFID